MRIVQLAQRGLDLYRNVRVAGLVAKADRLRDAGKYLDAAMAYEAVLRIWPANTGIRVQFANMLKDCGRLEEAEQAYRRALLDDPEAGDTHLQLGHALKLQGRTADALDAYRRAVRKAPGDRHARLELIAQGDSAEEFLDRDAIAVMSVREIAGIHRRLEKIDVALAEIRQSLPAARALLGYPPGQWASLRQAFDLPPAPPRAQPQKIHVVLAGAVDREADLHARIVSLQRQTVPGFTASILLPADANDIDRYIQADDRFAVVRSFAEAVAGREGLVLLCGGDDRLHPHALAWLEFAVALTGAHAVSCDREIIEPGDRGDVFARVVLRGPADPDSLADADTLGSTLLATADEVRSALARYPAGSLAEILTDLGMHLARDFRIAHVPLPLAAGFRDDVEAHRRADAVGGETPPRGEAGRETAGSGIALSVIVPTRAGNDDVFTMLETLHRRAKAPQRIEYIVVDNGCTDPGRLQKLQALEESRRARVLRIPGLFNWSHLNNEAAHTASGDNLLFANDDMEMLSDGWDTVVAGHLARRSIGAVGAKLLYPDGTVQHAGVLTGWKSNTVIHDGLGLPATDPGPNFRYRVARRVSAVTGAFIAVRKADFVATGGFDARTFAVSYGDIDFCFRLRERGLSILWTPHIVLTHYESKTRGFDYETAEKAARNRAEEKLMTERWRDFLERDAGVNPHWVSFGRPMKLLFPPSPEAVVDFMRPTGRGIDPHVWRGERGDRVEGLAREPSSSSTSPRV